MATPGLPLRDKRKGQAAVAELQAKQKAWEKAQAQQSAAKIDPAAVAAELIARATDLSSGKLIVSDVPGANDDQLRVTVDALKKRAVSHAVLLGAASADKVSFIAVVNINLCVVSASVNGRPLATSSSMVRAKLSCAFSTIGRVSAGLITSRRG